jgi:hypothetical protein
VINLHALGLALMEAVLHEEDWAAVLGISEGELARALTTGDGYGGAGGAGGGGGAGSAGGGGNGSGGRRGGLLLDMYSGGSTIRSSFSSSGGQSNGGGYPTSFVVFTSTISLLLAARLHAKGRISAVAAWVLSTLSVAKLACVLLHPLSIVLPSTAASMLLATAPFQLHRPLSTQTATAYGMLLFACLLWNRHSLLASLLNCCSYVVHLGTSAGSVNGVPNLTGLTYHHLQHWQRLPPPAESMLVGACLIFLGGWGLAVCSQHFR